MSNLKLYYSSGSSLTDEFRKDPSESIGGIVTSVQIKDFNNNLFRAISHNAVSNGSKEYRIIFMVNDSGVPISNLKIYNKIPIVTTTLNPADLTLNPGDIYYIPTNAVGDWTGQAGKVGTYDGANWTFALKSYAKFKVGFIQPIDITLNEEVLSESFVDTLDGVFSFPFGVDLVNVDSINLAGASEVGDGVLAAGAKLAMVIEREVPKDLIGDELFSCPPDGVFNWENMIIESQKALFKFSYDIPD